MYELCIHVCEIYVYAYYARMKYVCMFYKYGLYVCMYVCMVCMYVCMTVRMCKCVTVCAGSMPLSTRV